VTQQFLNRTDIIAILQQIGAVESHRIVNATVWPTFRPIKPRWSKF
jgi:hypothetical protein